MAEGKRRSEVKKFTQNKEPHVKRRKGHPNLFDEIFASGGGVCQCDVVCANPPGDGTDVVVKADRNKRLCVNWGNQLVARIPDSIGLSLVEALALRRANTANAWWATVVTNGGAQGVLSIKFHDVQ